MFRSLRWRLGIVYPLTIGLMLGGFSFYIYECTQTLFRERFDDLLQEKMQAFKSTVDRYSVILEPNYETTPESVSRVMKLINYVDTTPGFFEGRNLQKLDDEWRSRIYGLHLRKDYIMVYYPSGEVMQKSDNIPEAMQNLLAKRMVYMQEDTFTLEYLAYDQVPYRVIVFPYMRDQKVKYRVQIASSYAGEAGTLQKQIRMFAYSIPAVVILLMVTAFVCIKKALQPVRVLTQDLDSMTHTDAGRQLSVRMGDAELKALMRSFNTFSEQLGKAFRHTEEFSSEVAHELKTPLAVIQGEIDVALRKERSQHEYKEALYTVLDETKQMLRLIEDVLLITKLECHPSLFPFEAIRVNAFLDDISDYAAAACEEKHQQFSSDMNRELLWVRGNGIHLKRIFINLLDNAIKFTPENGTITLTSRREKDTVIISVSDTGIGIREEDIPLICDRFFHREHTDDATPSGSGLGLSIVKSIVAMHQGTLDISSRVGYGSTFSITLPLITTRNL